MVELTLDSQGTQSRPGLNFLDRVNLVDRGNLVDSGPWSHSGAWPDAREYRLSVEGLSSPAQHLVSNKKKRYRKTPAQP